MSPDIHTALQSAFAEWPETVGSPVPEMEIDNAEKMLGITLPDDYREFLKFYGAGVVHGHGILGLRQPEFLGDEPPYFTEQSKEFRELLGAEEAEYANIVVIEVDDSGNPIGFLPPDPMIFVIDHNFGGRFDLADSFEHYLEKIIARDPSVL